MSLWILLVGLLLAALAFIVQPLYRESGRLTPLLAVCVVLTVVLSAGLYHIIGHPGVESGAGTAPDIDGMVISLAKRLEEQPDNINGWQMLGRSYQTLQRYDEAIAAYEKAIELEGAQNSHTLVALALLLMEAEGDRISGRANSLLENALTIEPSNPNALFYSGMAAASRGDTALAADRWEFLLDLDAPPEIRELLRQRIDEWRGGGSPAMPPPTSASAVVVVDVALSDEARAALPDDASVYIIARDRAQPSPPIAVARHRLSELPMTIELGDRDSMVPGRALSNFPEFELVVRASSSGNPIEQSGDWFGSLDFVAGPQKPVELIIDKQIQ